jgi:hypothetical protein
MHPYRTNRGERERVLLGILAVSVLAALGLRTRFDAIHFVPPWYVDAPSVLFFYALFFRIFDNWLWRVRALRHLGIVHIGNLSGTWNGYLESSYDRFATQHQIRMTVIQTWTEISIMLETRASRSRSRTASVLCEPNGEAHMVYEYQNDPSGPAVQTMHAHRGTASLTWRRGRGREILDGDYYTGRDRQNHGILHVERRIQNKLQQHSG